MTPHSFRPLQTLFTALLLLACCPVYASIHVVYNNYFGSFTQHAIAAGNRAYVGVGYRVYVLDISNPSTPSVLGYSNYMPDRVNSLVLSGTTLYTGCRAAGLRAIDVSNSTNPYEIGACGTYEAWGVAVAGNYAYVADWSAGLRIIDVSNPAAPQLRGTCKTYGAWDVAVSGNYAYVADDSYGLRIINISSPSSPYIVGTYDTSGSARGVALSGNYAYVADGTSGLQVIDVSNPSSPSRKATYNTSGWARDVAVAAGRAYVADGESGLVVLDVTNPTAPTYVDSCSIAGYARGVDVLNGYAYVAGYEGGFSIVFVGYGTAPGVTSVSPSSGINAGSVAVSLTGMNFQAGASVKLSRIGHADIAAASVSVVSASQINCTFDITDVMVGFWDVVVSNPNGESGTFAAGFRITSGPAPTITGITPDSGLDNQTVSIADLTGTGFQAGAGVSLRRPGYDSLQAANVNVVSSTRITCEIDLTGVATGLWNVVVINPDDQSATLAEAFSVNGAFSDIGAALIGVSGGSVAWGDYDDDGDLDLVVMGNTGDWFNTTPTTRLYRNDNGVFNDSGVVLIGVYNGSAVWADLDNDGSLDLILTGDTAGYPDYNPVCRIYMNRNGELVDSGVSLTVPRLCSIECGDYDNDGDLDVFVTGGYWDDPYFTKVYRNDAGSFTEVITGLEEFSGSLALGDYDNDGDLDVAIVGPEFGGENQLRVYRNDGGVFSDSGMRLLHMGSRSLAWADFDNDGDLDLGAGGYNGALYCNDEIFRNDGGTLVPTGIFGWGYPDEYSYIAWTDYNNDGVPDLARCTDWWGNGPPGIEIPGLDSIDVRVTHMAWGDYDGDGDLDLVVTGRGPNNTYVTRIYRNNSITPNTRPSAPTGLSAAVDGDQVVFSWQPGSDSETPAAGLSYNLRVGSTPGGSEVLSAMADPVAGCRRIPALGNAQKNLRWTIRNLPEGPLYWSVQAIDSAFAGSAWAPEQVVGGTVEASIGDARRLPNGAGVSITGKIVTAAFEGFFYIEEDDRTAGIRVNAGTAVAQGDRVTVTGVLGTLAGERVIEADSVTIEGQGAAVPSPLGLPMRALRRLTLGQAGLDTAGLLVRVCGKVGQVGDTYIYLDDGSGLIDGTTTGPEANAGLRIACDPAGYTPGDHLIVTGVSACFETFAETTAPRVLTRRVSDVVRVTQ